MKKRKLITMLTALVLVAVVGVGATLAYMSSTASLTNTFTVGNVKITLDETEYLDGVEQTTRTQVGNNDTYGKMYPGKIVTKDPLIHVDTNSSNCYLFMSLQGMNDLKSKGFSMANKKGFVTTESVVEINSSWKKFDTETGVDGIYYYVGNESEAIECNKDTSIEPLFNYVKYNNAEKGNITAGDVIIKACAYQSEGVDFIDITEDLLFIEN